MRKFIASIMMACTLFSGSLFAQSFKNINEKELQSTHDVFSNMGITEFKSAMSTLKDKATKAGLVEEAKTFESLIQNPEKRFSILDEIEDRIENGDSTYLTIFKVMPKEWCQEAGNNCIFGAGLLSLKAIL